MAAELALSIVNERRLGPAGEALSVGRPGRLFRAAKWTVRAGLALQLAGRRPATTRAASALYLAAGLLFRFAWVYAGRTSAGDDRRVAETARKR
jgi:hypothetical protein